MALDTLDHFSIRTLKLDETKDFFEALGLKDGERPHFDFPGHWLYAGDHPVVHLVGIDPDNPQGLYDYLGEGDTEFGEGGGAVDHVAFRASDPEGLKGVLKGLGIEYREREVPDMKLFQIFAEDPNGVTVELNYWQD
ncbi:MAG: glyoxalase [Rhodospirillales bacterium]|nr:glyoxalase [Rhodospirillales bacterium]